MTRKEENYEREIDLKKIRDTIRNTNWNVERFKLVHELHNGMHNVTVQRYVESREEQ